MVTLRQFPQPMQDETLHSILARYYVSSFYLNWRSMADDLVGRRWISSLNSVPVGLEHIGKEFSSAGIPFEDMLWNHSYFPYYTVLISENEREKYKNLAWHHVAKEEMISLGMLLRQNRIGQFLRFCPQCMWSDLQEYGFSYCCTCNPLLT